MSCARVAGMGFDMAVFVLTDVASVYTLYVVCAGLALHAWWRGRLAVAWAIVITSIGCGVSVLVLKEWLAVPRPPEPLIAVDTYAFPSGHAAGVAFLGAVVWGYVRYVWPQRVSPTLTVWLLLVVLTVGFSRIWFQVHTIEQVLAGYSVGVVWGIAFLGYSYSRWQLTASEGEFSGRFHD